jgi:Ca2+-binding EF-hand superfamily protein
VTRKRKKMKSLFFVFLLVCTTEACWLYDKGKTVEKIKKNLAVQHRNSVDRQYFKDEMEKMPRIFSWAVQQIGVEAAFASCDANQDGTITLQEMRDTSTCLDSCFKLSIINLAI